MSDLPDYAVDFRGRPACPCQAEWLPVFEQLAQARGILPPQGLLPTSQIIGGAVQSGGTHATGGADDTWPLTTINDVAAYVRLSRDMGADATWLRPKNWDGKSGVAHVHRVLRGCPHNGPARYQITAVDQGRNGLGSGGMGGTDDGPRPLSMRTWREGIEWAKTQLEDDVAAEDVWQFKVPERDDKTEATERSAEFLLADAHARAGAAAQSARRTEAAVKALAKALGPEVEKAVAAALEDAVVNVNVTVGGGESK